MNGPVNNPTTADPNAAHASESEVSDSSVSTEPPPPTPAATSAKPTERERAPRGPSRLERLLWPVLRHLIAYPLRMQPELIANLAALKDGPRSIADVARYVYDEIYGVDVTPTLTQQQAPRQAFTLLAEIGAIGCTKMRKSDLEWLEVAITPLGLDIVTTPAAWFEGGYLLRSQRKLRRR